MKRLILAILLLTSTVAASLIELDDQISNTSLFLGGGPAVAAYSKKALFGLGSSIYSSHLQNSEVLDDMPPYYYKNVNPPANSSCYGFFSYPINNLWLTVKYNKDYMRFFSYKIYNKEDKDLYNFFYSQGITEKSSLGLSWELLPKNYLGIEFSSNQSIFEYKNKNSSALDDIALIHSYYRYDTSNKYGSLSLGYIGNIGELMKLSIVQKFSERARMHSFCDYYPLTDGDYSQVIPNTTAIGAIFDLSNNFEIALGQETIWGVKYLSDFENRDEVAQVTYYYMPYNLYTVALSADYNYVMFQLIGSTARQVGAYDIEEDSDSFFRGYAYTSAGLNIQIQPLANHKIILGGFRYKLIEEREENPGQAWSVENTRTYLGYIYYFDLPQKVEKATSDSENSDISDLEKEEQVSTTSNLEVIPEKDLLSENNKKIIEEGDMLYKLSANEVKPGETFSISVINKGQLVELKGYVTLPGMQKVIFQDLGDGFYVADINIPADFQQGSIKAQILFIDAAGSLIQKEFEIQIKY